MKRILYVGTLIDRKNADKILIALSNLPFQFEFTVIGEGLNLEMLKKLSRKLGIDSQVFFSLVLCLLLNSSLVMLDAS